MTATPKSIVGYQYSPDTFAFIGEYSFPDNLDKEETHLPPYTTLTPPPTAGSGERAFWRDGAWVLETVAATTRFSQTLFHNLEAGFLDDCKRFGLYAELMQFYENNPHLMQPESGDQNGA
jgi:hypothetical protein